MKTFAIALVALLVIGGAVPMALAQQDNQSQAPAAPPAPSNQASPGASSGGDVKAPSAGGGVDARGGISADAQIRRDRSDDAAGAASPRTEVTRTSFFGLSPTAAVIVSVAVLLVVILAIVAMTNNSRGTTYIDRDRGF